MTLGFHVLKTTNNIFFYVELLTDQLGDHRKMIRQSVVIITVLMSLIIFYLKVLTEFKLGQMIRSMGIDSAVIAQWLSEKACHKSTILEDNN